MLITYCCIFRDEDQKWLQGLIDSIPVNSKIILMRTEKGLINDCYKVGTETIDGNKELTRCEYKYKNWSFGDARNACHQFVETDWIFMLDSDERVQIDNIDLEYLSKLPKDVGACTVNVVSYFTQEGKPTTSNIAPLLRLYRNNVGVSYKFRCHEQNRYSIVNAGLKVAETTISVRHRGYELTKEGRLAKYKRNSELMCLDIGENVFESEDEANYIKFKLFQTLKDELITKGLLTGELNANNATK